MADHVSPDGWWLAASAIEGDGGGSDPVPPPADPPGGWLPPVEEAPSVPPDEPPDPPVEEVVVVYRWVTQEDGRVCPLCGPLDGRVWEGDAGPWPPLHAGCRCERVAIDLARWSRRPVQELWGAPGHGGHAHLDQVRSG